MSYLIDPHHPAMVELLARLFPEPEEAGLIVERAGFQRGAIPLFRLAEDFWNRVMHDAVNGRNHGGVRAVLEQAVKRCPHNPALGEHLRRVRSLGSSTSAAAPRVMGAGLTGKIGSLDGISRTCLVVIACLQVAAIGLALIAVLGHVRSHPVPKPPQPQPQLEQPPAHRSRAAVVPPAPPSIDDVEIVLLDDEDDSSEPDPLPTTRRARGASRAKSKPPTAAEPAPAGEPFHYRTYNCIVGPDEPDAGTRTNQKGECSASDRRAFRLPQ